MSKIRITIFLALVLLIFSCENRRKKSVPIQENERGTVQILINFGEKERFFEYVPWQDGQTVYDILMQLDRDNFSLSVADTLYEDLGHLIFGFDGVKNQRRRFWTYCVNGKPANKAVDKFVLNHGDKVSWYFTKETNPCK